jgi:hypothetical protein
MMIPLWIVYQGVWKMKLSCKVRRLICLVVGGGLCLAICLAICQCGGSDEPRVSNNFPLCDYIDVVIRSVKAREGSSAQTGKELELTVSLINKTPDEIEISFLGKVYQSSGGFILYIGTQRYHPEKRLLGSKEYNFLPEGYGLLPARGSRAFQLLLELPAVEARRVLADPEIMRVVVRVCNIGHKGIYTEIIGENRDVVGRWERPQSLDE